MCLSFFFVCLAVFCFVPCGFTCFCLCLFCMSAAFVFVFFFVPCGNYPEHRKHGTGTKEISTSTNNVGGKSCDATGDCFRNASASAVRCTVDGSSSQIFLAYEIFPACGIFFCVSRFFLFVPPHSRLQGTTTRNARHKQTLGKHKREIPPGTNEQAHRQKETGYVSTKVCKTLQNMARPK